MESSKIREFNIPQVAGVKLPATCLHPGPQVKKYRAEWEEDGKDYLMVAEARHDDQCGNGHNTFAITATIYSTDRVLGEATIRNSKGKTLWCYSGGCCHDEIAKHVPELAPYIKWHLVSTNGPMHYLYNVLYLAGNRDCWGLKKGEKRQILHGGDPDKPVWTIAVLDENGKEVDICSYKNSRYRGKNPPDISGYRVKWVPWCRVGDGKERELDSARRAAVWPDATDEQLMLPAEELKKLLLSRLPGLMEEFKADVESLGFEY